MNLKDLEQYRDSNGFIDFDKIEEEMGFEAFSPRRECRGTETREKIWLHFDDTTVLLKTVEENTNLLGTCYAELLTAELARQVDIPTAKVDLIKYKGHPGVISEKINREGEQLHSLREYIGDEDIPDDPVPEITGLDFVFDNMIRHLSHTDMAKDDKYALLQSMMKLMAFDAITLNTDRHTENISFIERMNDGKKEIVLAPLYDNEFSLMLETPAEDLEVYMSRPSLFHGFVDAQEPKIAPKYPGIETEFPCHHQNLLDSLVGMDDQMEDTIADMLDRLDIKKAMRDVQQQIGAKIPQIYMNAAGHSFIHRSKQIKQNLMLDFTHPQNDMDI